MDERLACPGRNGRDRGGVGRGPTLAADQRLAAEVRPALGEKTAAGVDVRVLETDAAALGGTPNTAGVGTAVTEEEVINAIRSVPTHYSTKASELPIVRPGTKAWEEAVEAIATGDGVNVRVPTATDAKNLLREARGNMNRYKRYTDKRYNKGYEMHPNESATRNAPHNDLPHVKWKDWHSTDGGSGHIFFDKPN